VWGLLAGREGVLGGGYGASRTISRVFLVDEYYRDAVVMGFEGGAWRKVGDAWGDGERVRVGKIVVVDDDGCPTLFMLDGNEILRYFSASGKSKGYAFILFKHRDDARKALKNP